MNTIYPRFWPSRLIPAGHHCLAGLLLWLALSTYWPSSPTAHGQSFSLVSGTPFYGVNNSSVAIADVDGDGKPDVFITGLNSSGTPITKLYQNNGGGSFSEVSSPFDGVQYSSVAIADVVGDSKPDVFITGQNSSITPIAKLYQNNGGGSFSEVSGTPFDAVESGSVAIADVVGDGKPDVLITGANSSFTPITKLYQNNGGGSFSEVSGTPFDAAESGSVAIADVVGDSKPDILITGLNSSGDPIAKLYQNNGGGSFSEVSGTPFDGVQYSSVAIADVDADGKPDVFITGQNSSGDPIAKLYQNNGGGSFSEVSGTPFDAVQYSSVAIANVIDDSKPDVLITGFNSSFTPITKLYQNNGGGSFSEVSGTPFQRVTDGSVAIADVDGDSKPDILITGLNSSGDPIAKLYQNTTTVLPVTLRYFNGRMTDAGALLGWATATEHNNAYFLLERSRDLIGFEAIATLPSQAVGGNSALPFTYSFTDTQPLPGVTYYRLTQVDKNGTRTLGRPIALSKENQPPVLYPNPLGTLGEATLEPALAYRSYEVVDMQGRVVQQSAISGTLSRLSVGTLPTGVYLLRVQTEGGGRQVFRLLR